jgi:hypothetical protein
MAIASVIGRSGRRACTAASARRCQRDAGPLRTSLGMPRTRAISRAAWRRTGVPGIVACHRRRGEAAAPIRLSATAWAIFDRRTVRKNTMMFLLCSEPK